MATDNTKIPKVFISYSWAVQDRVKELADRLIANGIEVIIDIYDLKEGQDKYQFMEQSVNNPQIDNVLIICDKTYTEKANNRTGGVGDETVIITPELYGNLQQTKFIPVIFEKDSEDNVLCPLYIKSRIYIDLSSGENFESEFEKLIRDIFKKPLYRKPALGKRPEWLDEQTEAVDFSALKDVLKQVQGCFSANKIKQQILFKRTNDIFLSVAQQYILTGSEPLEKEFPRVLAQTQKYRDLYMDFFAEVIASDTISKSNIDK